MHFVMHAFNNHVGILHNVTPIDLLGQSAVLFFNSSKWFGIIMILDYYMRL